MFKFILMSKVILLKTVLLTISSMIATYMASNSIFLAIIIGTVALWGLRKNSLLILEKYRGGVVLNAGKVSFSKGDYPILFLTSFLSLTLCSECSPLYAFNHWVDPHVYFPIGSGMLHGLMPYRDLFDHKGPILYFIHTIATLVSNTSLIGVWCFEIIYSFFFLYYGLKTIWLFNKDASVWIVVLLSLITYTNASFERGDSCEELCLPLLTYTVYIAFKCTLLKRLPSCKETLAIGICLATVFWVKFTICALFLGWFLVILLIAYREKRLRSLFSIILFICLGTLVITIPVLGFYIYNGAIEDLFNVYLLCNLKYSPHDYGYGVDVSLISSIISRLRYSFSICKDSPFICLSIIITFFSFWFSKSKRPLLAYTLQIIFPIITLVAISGYNYYSFILSAFAPIGAYVLFEHFRIKFSRPNTLILKITYVLFSIFVLYSLSENTKDISLKRESDPHYRFAEVINSTSDATLLEYRDRIGKDPTLGGHHSYGFYTVTGIVPTCKYFALTRAYDILEQIAYQDSMVNEGAFDFLVTSRGDYDLEYYSPIDSLDGYYLYKKTEKFY